VPIGYLNMAARNPAPPAASVDADPEPSLRLENGEPAPGADDDGPGADTDPAAAVLLNANSAVNVAVDELVAQIAKDGKVTRLGIAKLRDAIDDLRQAIPRQTSRRRSNNNANGGQE
jgi:hypothetical protein